VAYTSAHIIHLNVQRPGIEIHYARTSVTVTEILLLTGIEEFKNAMMEGDL